MAPYRRNIDDVLARINFPLFTLQMITNRHVLVGGGGGSAKTGVANGFEIFELSHDGKKFHVEEVTRHETGPNVVMNCSVIIKEKCTYLVADQETHCQLYKVNPQLGKNQIDTSEIEDKKKKSSKNNIMTNVKLEFILSPLDCVQTDFIGPEPLCRIVRIHPNGKLLATGGTDGIVQIWKFPNLQHLRKLKAHSKEIDDIDFSSDEKYIISVAKDGLAILWNCLTGNEIKRLTWNQPVGTKYLYKRCRFGVSEQFKDKTFLYMLTNPIGATANNHDSYLQQWLPDEGIVHKSAKINESISALAVRDDGRFIAIGTMFSGSVAIYTAFNLRRVLNVPAAHSMFVTGLEFLPVLKNQNFTISSAAEAAVLSISVDNQVCIHTLPFRKTIPLWLAIVILIFTLFLTFLFCSYLGL